MKMPDLESIQRFLDGLENADWLAIAGAAEVLFGLVLLRFGWTFYRVYLVFMGMAGGAALGLFVTFWVGATGSSSLLLGAIIGGLLFGLLAVPLFRAVLFVMSGAGGGMIVYFLVRDTGISDLTRNLAIAAAFMLFAGLSVVLFKAMMIFVLSLLGAAQICQGVLIVLSVRAPGAETWLVETKVVLVALFLLLFLVGMFLQVAASRRIDVKGSMKAEVAKAKGKVRKKFKLAK